MTTITNKQRAQWAESAIERYNEAKEGRTVPCDEPATILTDLLCDLMHYAKRRNIDIEHAFNLASSHFQDEEMELAMDMVHEIPFVLAAMKKARDELHFLQLTGARGANDTETREALHALDQAIARAEGDAP